MSMTWNDAKNYCETLKFGNLYNAHLIEIYNSTQQNFLTEKIIEIDQNIGYNIGWWLGLTDSETEGIWKWANSGNIATYFYWQYGQPDNYWGGSDFVYYNVANYGWDDCTYHDYCSTICQLLF